MSKLTDEQIESLIRESYPLEDNEDHVSFVRAIEEIVAQESANRIATAYGYLWHVNAGQDAPAECNVLSISPEAAAYKARQVLRDLLTNEQRGEGINAVRESLQSQAPSHQYTFSEFVEYGKNNGGNIVNGMPWSFKINGTTVTHENDQCYLICTKVHPHTLHFTPTDLLVFDAEGNPKVIPAPVQSPAQVALSPGWIHDGDCALNPKTGERVPYGEQPVAAQVRDALKMADSLTIRIEEFYDGADMFGWYAVRTKLRAAMQSQSSEVAK